MADAPLAIVLEMVAVLLESILDSFFRIMALYGSLLESLGLAAEVGGPLGLAVSVAVLGLVGFFVARMAFGEAKKFLLLFVAGAILAYLLILGAVV
ncbi:MAG: hypothetical protein HY520_02185 [Candidatus Aenigmarchaeota archaeon]|nr:hypothetical protein [Candidatus Aenigmarchaeota archaeon]